MTSKSGILSKWKLWIDQESQEVKDEILCGNVSTNKFKDFNDKIITLKELEELDNKYNL